MKVKEIVNNHTNMFGVDEDAKRVLAVLAFAIHERVVEIQWYHSGGGCMHYLHRLDDGRIVIVHTSDLCLEVTYDKYDSIDEYLEIDEDGNGLGWEYVKPNWNDRISQDIYASDEMQDIANKVTEFTDKL